MSYSRAATVVVLVVALAGLSLASIENKPVKVTHRNSGPKYEIEETIDKTKLTPVTENNQQNPQSNNINTDNFETPVGQPPMIQARPPVAASNDGDDDTIGHIAIRRIFLVPMMRPQMPAASEEDSPPSSRVSSSSGGSAERDRDEMPSMFAARPSFWPFSPPSFPHHQHQHQHNHHQPGHVHLFGGDTASRPPMMSPEASEDRPLVNAGSGERENAPEDQPPPREQPLGDPVQMLVDLMRQAINQAVLSPNNFFNPSDLNRPSTQGEQNNEGPLLFRPPTPPQQPAEEASSDRKHQGTDLQSRPSTIKPASGDESSEEVVEIAGKKYLRKTVVNRHIGENIVLVTRRLIFVPLNETSEEGTTTVAPVSSSSTTTTTTPVPVEASTTTTTTTAAEEPAATSVDSRKVEEPTTTSTSTTTTTTTTTSTTAAPTTTSQEPAEVSSSSTTSTTELPSSTTTTTTTTTQAPEKEETTTESEKLDEKNKEPTTLTPSS